MNWNWTLNDDGGALVIVSGGVLGSASEVTLTFSSFGVACGATWEVGGASCGEGTADEGVGEL